MEQHKALKNPFNIIVIVAALGYFVDIYDLVLFSIVRRPSLLAIGVPAKDLLSVGANLLSWQMGGMLIGGILWGIWGDKKGRLSVLFGSIIMYSIANIANGFVSNIEMYSILRFAAGVGLAGELGAGITLVSETMTKEQRGYGTTLVSVIGILGAVVGVIIGDIFKNWQMAYFVGGGLGFILLLLRIGAYESGLYKDVKGKTVRKGDFLSLFSSWKKALKYMSVVLIAVPVWYVVGILITFCTELGKEMHMSSLPDPGKGILYCYIGISIGGLLSGVMSQLMKNRIKVIALFLLLTFIFSVAYFFLAWKSLLIFYSLTFLLGIATGYWAVFMTTASEQFGTNIRATVTTTAPNFVRGAVVPMTLGFKFLTPAFGGNNGSPVKSAIVIGVIVFAVAFLSIFKLEESYHKDLDYVEE